MDRIIQINVFGNHLTKDNKNAGTRGEANITTLRITFDEGWDKFDRKVTFWDARGLNPVVIDLLPTLAESTRVYRVPIPQEPMAEAGEFTFVIEGSLDDKVQRSLSGKLEVEDAPIATNAGQPVPPTPDELSQVRQSLDEIKTDIIDVKDAKEIIEESEANAKKYSEQAVASVGKTSYIGENGNWFAWSTEFKVFYDTGVKAQAGSEVYVGDNPPDSADIWIDPNGKATAYTAEEIDAMFLERRTHYVEGKLYGEVHWTKGDSGPDMRVTMYLNEPLEVGREYPYETSEGSGVFVLKEGNGYIDGTVGGYGVTYDGDTVITVNGVSEDSEDYIIIGEKPVYHPLNENFIPGGIARVKDVEAMIKEALEAYNKPAVRKATITLNVSDWVDDDNGCYQVVDVAGATPYSMVDLQPTAEQLSIFHEKDVAFVAENEGGVITVFCIGVKPTNDYVIQATVTEVEVDE